MWRQRRYWITGVVLVAATSIGLLFGYRYFAVRHRYAREMLREYTDARFPRSNDIFTYVLSDVRYEEGVAFRCTPVLSVRRPVWLDRSSPLGSAFYLESDGEIYDLSPDPAVLVDPAGDLTPDLVPLAPRGAPLEQELTFRLDSGAVPRSFFTKLTGLAVPVYDDLPSGTYELAVLVSLRYYLTNPLDGEWTEPKVAEWIYRHDHLVEVRAD